MKILVALLFGSGVIMSAQCISFTSPQDQSEGTQEAEMEMELVFESDFDSDHDRWNFVDDGWKVKESENGHVLSLHQKKSNYEPKVRSPRHIALLKEAKVEEFQLDIDVLSTHKDYNHRDACLFFGYQSPTQFYYVHFGKKTDPHANQIFLVNNADRTKISTQTTDGTPWDDQWHKVRIVRDTQSGEIQVFFDDMETPAMTATDKTFTWGQIGVGSFDDTADFDNIQLRGRLKEQD